MACRLFKFSVWFPRETDVAGLPVAQLSAKRFQELPEEMLPRDAQPGLSWRFNVRTSPKKPPLWVIGQFVHIGDPGLGLKPQWFRYEQKPNRTRFAGEELADEELEALLDVDTLDRIPYSVCPDCEGLINIKAIHSELDKINFGVVNEQQFTLSCPDCGSQFMLCQSLQWRAIQELSAIPKAESLVARRGIRLTNARPKLDSSYE